MGRPALALAVLLLALPTATAQAQLEGHLMAAAVAADQASSFEGRGLFLGFTQQRGVPTVGWSATAATAQVTITTYTSDVYAGNVGFPAGGDTTETVTYEKATLERTLGTKPAANDFEFWMMVTPLPDGHGEPFHVAGSLPTRELVAKPSVFYICDPVAPAPGVLPAPSDGSGPVEVQYRSPHAALEWKPASATGQYAVRGDFVVSVFQADFDVTGADGRTDHYSTGDPTPTTDPRDPAVPAPVARYERTRADITLRGATLLLQPNGRDLQLDLARLSTHVQFGVDFADAHGRLVQSWGERAVAGQVAIQSSALALDLLPSGDRVDARFAGTADAISVDGKPLPLAPATTSVLAEAPASLLAVLGAAFAAGCVAFAAVALRRRADPVLLLARAQALFEVGRHAAALRVCRRLLRVDPANIDATTVAAMSLVRLGRPAEAKPLLRLGLAAGGDHQGLLSVVEALVLFHEGDPATAARRLQEAFRAYPSLNNELAAVDLLDQLLVHVADATPLPQVVSP
jgi:hypothetical protein